MSWYYAFGGQQQGPVDDSQLDALIQSGRVTPDTLVWREGMANWQPLREARPGAGAGVPPSAGAPPVIAGAEPGEILCAECGGRFSRENAIQYGSAWVCATCKPVFVQKLKEGAAFGGGSSPSRFPQGPVEAEQLLAQIRSRDPSLDIGGCLKRGWDLVANHLGISIGVTLLLYVTLIGGGAIPCVGPFIQMFIQGPIMAGFYCFFLKLIREGDASVGDAFLGFKLGFVPLFLIALVTALISVAIMGPAIGLMVLREAGHARVPEAWIIVAFAVSALPIIYLSVSWIFANALVVDRSMEFWTAMETSRKVVGRQWLKVLLFLIVCGLVVFAGVVALCVGALFALPMVMAAMAYAYEDLFSVPHREATTFPS